MKIVKCGGDAQSRGFGLVGLVAMRVEQQEIEVEVEVVLRVEIKSGSK